MACFICVFTYSSRQWSTSQMLLFFLRAMGKNTSHSCEADIGLTEKVLAHCI